MSRVYSRSVLIMTQPLSRGKQTKSSFHNKNIASITRSLKLLHLDLFGPTRTANLGGKKYGLAIVDDFFRFIWVIFFIHKDEAYEAFKIFLKKSSK